MPLVQLRPYKTSDARPLFEAASESVAEVHPWLPWCHAGYQLGEAEDWLRLQAERFQSGSEFQFAIESPQGAYLGGCGLDQIHTGHQFANLGYWIRTSRAGRGLAAQAVRALAQWAFSETPLVRLEIVAGIGNVRSHRVAEKAGAVREGVLFKRLHLHGVWHDAVLFSITRSDAPAA